MNYEEELAAGENLPPAVVAADAAAMTGSEPPTQSPFFDTSALQADLKGRSVRGGAITILSQIVRFVLSMGGTMVLARILTPKDYGLVAMVAPITGFVGMFKDMGLSAATVQRDKITHEQISTLFWINIAFSVAAMAITIAAAPIVGWFYHDGRATWVTLAMGLFFILGGATAQHEALLNRQMRFRSLAYINIASVVITLLTGITCALLGMRYWALVAMTGANGVANLILMWLTARWWPGRPVRHSGVRSMLKFGGNLTAFNIANYFARNLDNVLVGRFCGEQALGLYSKAYNLLMLQYQQIMQPLSSVAVPAMTRLQSDPNRLARYYLKALNLCALLTVPFVGLLIVTRHEIIRIVLGPKWDAVVPIFSMLAISAAIQPIVSTVGWLYVSTGRTDRMLRWGIVWSILIVGSFVAGLPYGPVGVACSFSIVIWLLAVPTLWYAVRGLPIRLQDIARALTIPAAVALLTVGVCLAAKMTLAKGWPPLAVVAMCALSTVAAYAVILGVRPKERAEYLSIFNELRRRSRGPS